MQRRVVPVSAVTIGVFAVLAVFQLFVMAGGFELRASLVKRVAPSAYEPFLRMVGEHPDSRPSWSMAGRDRAEKAASAMADVAGFDPELGWAVDERAGGAPAPAPPSGSESIIEPTTPIKNPAVVIPDSTPTNAVEEPLDLDSDEPVG